MAESVGGWRRGGGCEGLGRVMEAIGRSKGALGNFYFLFFIFENF